MAANDFNAWSDGFVYGGVNDGTNTNGSMNYWDSGFPFVYIFPTAGTPASTSIKRVINVGYASIKSVSGVPIANIKKIINIT